MIFICIMLKFISIWFVIYYIFLIYGYHGIQVCWSITISTCFIVIQIQAYSAKSLQSCLTLCNPIEGSPPGSTVPGILQARTLEWVAISFSNAWKWKVKVKTLSSVWLLGTPWTAAYQAPLSMEFSRQEYWSGVLSPSPNMYITRCEIDH